MFTCCIQFFLSPILFYTTNFEVKRKLADQSTMIRRENPKRK